MLLKGVSSVHVFDHIPICLYVQIPCLVLFEWACAHCLCFLHISSFLTFYLFRENLYLHIIGLPLLYFLLDYCLLILMSLVCPYSPSSFPSLALSTVANEICLLSKLPRPKDRKIGKQFLLAIIVYEWGLITNPHYRNDTIYSSHYLYVLSTHLFRKILIFIVVLICRLLFTCANILS